MEGVCGFDICACLVSTGVIHGDLKAANVMLTQGGADQGSVWAAAYGHKVRGARQAHGCIQQQLLNLTAHNPKEFSRVPPSDESIYL